ncbi:MAG: hypothetical protein JWP36_119 [Paucimonas sp.]|nr:hypothetical protein [Paucimonas sp.]
MDITPTFSSTQAGPATRKRLREDTPAPRRVTRPRFSSIDSEATVHVRRPAPAACNPAWPPVETSANHPLSAVEAGASIDPISDWAWPEHDEWIAAPPSPAVGREAEALVDSWLAWDENEGPVQAAIPMPATMSGPQGASPAPTGAHYEMAAQLARVGVDNRDKIEWLVSRYRFLGIPFNAFTLPELNVADSLRTLGKGATSSVFEVEAAPGVMAAFKPSTGHAGDAARCAGLGYNQLNLEGRALFAARIGRAFFPRHVPACVPSVDLAIGGGQLGTLMSMARGHTSGNQRHIYHDEALPRDCRLYAHLRRLQEVLREPQAMKDQLHLMGLQGIRFYENGDICITGILPVDQPDDVSTHPEYKRGLTWLQTYWLLIGQMDGHSFNIMLDVQRNPVDQSIREIMVTGIDNDVSASSLVQPTAMREALGCYAYFCCLHPEIMDTEMADAVDALSEEWIYNLSGHFLTHEEERLAAVDRLTLMKEHCASLRAVGKLISPHDWNTVTPTDPATSLYAREVNGVTKMVVDMI